MGGSFLKKNPAEDGSPARAQFSPSRRDGPLEAATSLGRGRGWASEVQSACCGFRQVAYPPGSGGTGDLALGCDPNPAGSPTTTRASPSQAAPWILRPSAGRRCAGTGGGADVEATFHLVSGTSAMRGEGSTSPPPTSRAQPLLRSPRSRSRGSVPVPGRGASRSP